MVSTGSGNYIVLFSFLLVLNTGMLMISLMKNWKLIGIISYILSLIFFWTWLIASFEDEHIGATIFASLFFIQFYLLAIIEHYKAEKNMTLYQAILILTNNLSIFFACMYIFGDTEYNIRGLITIIIAAANAMVLTALFRQAKIDRNMIYLIIALVMSFVSLAIPIQLRGHVITMFWAVEAVLLFWLWKQSKINVFRLGFLAITLLTLISYTMDINYNYIQGQDLTLVINRMFITGLVVLASFAVNYFLIKREPKENDFTVMGNFLFKLQDIIIAYRFILICLTFIVPYLELNHQLSVYTDVNSYIHSFRDVSLATYTTLFVAVLAIFFRSKINKTKFILFSLSLVIYTLLYSYLVIDLREDIFLYEYYSSSYFLIHYLSLFAVGYVIYLLAKNIKTMEQHLFKPLCWFFVILSAAILSLELDHTVIWLMSNPESYYSLLYDVHTFGYPILWGIIAMILMIWGLKKKEVILRQISLISFGAIILKFYAYDVWHMSQTGRIISFVVLGVILLTVSFLQQKIKILVKEDKEDTVSDDENNDQLLSE